MAGDFRVELIFDADCPNVDQARARIRDALNVVGASAAWTEWDRAGAGTPDAFRAYGSPTVLVNGLDVAIEDVEPLAPDAKSCRVYADADGGFSGAPSSDLIVTAIRRAADSFLPTSAAS